MKITNRAILDLIKINVASLAEILKDSEEHDKKMHNLNKKNIEFVDLMNKEYGYGEWQDVNAKDSTFIPKEEFTKKYYIINNPALKEEQLTKDIEIKETDNG